MDRNGIKCAMMVAVSKAFGYKDEIKNFLDVQNSEVYQKILSDPNMTYDKRAKVAMIAAISRAMKFMQQNPASREKDVMQHVMNESDSILDAIENTQ